MGAGSGAEALPGGDARRGWLPHRRAVPPALRRRHRHPVLPGVPGVAPAAVLAHCRGGHRHSGDLLRLQLPGPGGTPLGDQGGPQVRRLRLRSAGPEAQGPGGVQEDADEGAEQRPPRDDRDRGYGRAGGGHGREALLSGPAPHRSASAALSHASRAAENEPSRSRLLQGGSEVSELTAHCAGGKKGMVHAYVPFVVLPSITTYMWTVAHAGVANSLKKWPRLTPLQRPRVALSN